MHVSHMLFAKNQFAAESYAFLLRKLPDKKLGPHFAAILDAVAVTDDPRVCLLKCSPISNIHFAVDLVWRECGHADL